MAYLPCENPSCNSYGKPHPNCKCYAGMKDGGDVKHFCSEDRNHDKDCEYFAQGGEAELKSGDVVPVDAPDDELKSGDIIPNDHPDDELKSGDIIPTNAPDHNPYESKGQQALAGVEGVGRGFLGPLETIASKAGQYFPKESLIPLGEKELGFTPEDIKARKEANPGTAAAGEAAGLVLGTLTGTGAVGAASKIGQAAARTAELGKVGSSFLSNAIANGTIQAGDEAGNWLLGKGDPQDAVAASLTNIAGAGLLGGTVGAASNAGSAILNSLGGNKFVGKLEGILTGIGAGAKSTYDPEAVAIAEKSGLFDHYDSSFGDVQKYYNLGKDAFQNIFHPHLASGLAAAEGYREGGFSQAIKNLIEVEALGKGVKVASKYAMVPVINKMLESGTFAGIEDALQHGINVTNGNNLMDKAVDGVLKGGTSPTINWFRSEEDRLKKRNQLDQEIQNSGINQEIQENQSNPFGYPEKYAKGGTIASAGKEAPLVGIGKHYPEQSMLLGLAKSRVSNYLNSVKPSDHQMGPIFDDPPDQTMQKKSYHKALDIANRPLSILEDVHKGSLDPEQVQHFQSMYPEINQLLQKKFTKRMIEAKMNDKKPSYNIRQGLSLLLGSPLSSDLSPQNIQAAQATFAPKTPTGPQSASVTKNKKNTSSLSKTSGEFSTPDQARLKEKQNGR